MLEKEIEQKVREAAIENGWLVYKWVSPSQRGVPDRIFIRDGRVVFIEFKRPGGHLTKLQDRTIQRLREQRMEVHVCDSVESGCNALGI